MSFYPMGDFTVYMSPKPRRYATGEYCCLYGTKAARVCHGEYCCLYGTKAAQVCHGEYYDSCLWELKGEREIVQTLLTERVLDNFNKTSKDR